MAASKTIFETLGALDEGSDVDGEDLSSTVSFSQLILIFYVTRRVGAEKAESETLC